jgi:CheY-like chemotaxis protein
MALILLIEDDAMIRENCKDLLIHGGYNCIVAKDGAEGVELTRTAKPDIIFCDITLPEMDGFQVKKALNIDEETADIPIVYLTGKTERSDLRQAMDIGAVDFITKPFKIKELYSAIERILGNQKAIKDSISQQVSSALADFVHVARHECNTPLHAIINLSRVLNERTDAENFHLIIDSIQKSGVRLHKTLNNIIDLMRLRHYSDDYPDNYESVDLAGIIKSRIPAFVKKYGVAIDFDSVTSNPIFNNLLKDDVLLLVNELLDNAGKFSEKNDTVEVKISGGGIDHNCTLSFSNFIVTDQPKFSVSDIKPFKQFNRAVTEQQGSGLGLHLVTIVCARYNLLMSIKYPHPNQIEVSVAFP